MDHIALLHRVEVKQEGVVGHRKGIATGNAGSAEDRGHTVGQGGSKTEVGVRKIHIDLHRRAHISSAGHHQLAVGGVVGHLTAQHTVRTLGVVPGQGTGSTRRQLQHPIIGKGVIGHFTQIEAGGYPTGAVKTCRAVVGETGYPEIIVATQGVGGTSGDGHGGVGREDRADKAGGVVASDDQVINCGIIGDTRSPISYLDGVSPTTDGAAIGQTAGNAAACPPSCKMNTGACPLNGAIVHQPAIDGAAT